MTVHRNVVMVAEVLYEVGNAGAFHWSQGIKQNVALISHHHVCHTFYVFCREHTSYFDCKYFRSLPYFLNATF